MLKKISVLVLILVALTLFLFLGNKFINKSPREDDGHAEGQIRLEKKLIEEFGIEISAVELRKLSKEIKLTGEITINQDKLANVVSPVSGIVTNVSKSVGDNVNLGETLAIIESREFAEAQEKYLSLIGNYHIAQSNFNREQSLIDKQLTTQEEYLQAKLSLTQAEHNLHAAKQHLKIYGLSNKQINDIAVSHGKGYSRYVSTAPLDGTIIERHVTLGEILEKDTKIFDIADLSTVWVDLNIYQKDFAYINKGQKVIISTGHGTPDVEGTISYVSPIVGEGTRTAIARIVLPNTEGHLKPGLFINAKVNIESKIDLIVVKKGALQEIDGKDAIFISEGNFFKLQEVETGTSNSTYVEITKGVELGEKYVSEGSFTLKSELLKSNLSGGDSD